MATFGQDTFTDTAGTSLPSHTADDGGTWTKHANFAGTPLISDANRARANSFTNSLAYHSGLPAAAEYDVQADLSVVSNGGNAGVVGRVATGAGTAYLANFLNAIGWRLQKIVAGTFTTLGTSTADGTSLTVGTVRTVRLEIRDAAKKLFRDGTELLSSVDNVITNAGQAGVWANTGSNTTGYHLDNFQASDPPGAGGRTWPGRLVAPPPERRERAWL